MFKYKNEDHVNLEYDYLFKIVICGDSGVGKSCLLLRFADQIWINNYIATIGVDFRYKTIQIDGKIVKFQIWDTAGHERFHSINSAYYRGCDGAILCYDVCRRDTFKNIPYHLEQIQEKAKTHSTKILVATKCDMKKERIISFNEGIQLSQQLNIPFLELSSKENRHVKDTFEEMARQCIANRKVEDKQNKNREKEFKRLQKQSSSNKISLTQIKQATMSKACCFR